MSKKPSIQELIMTYLASRGMSDRELAKKIGVSHGYLGTLRKGATMSLDKMEIILDTFPELKAQIFTEKRDATKGSKQKFIKSEFFLLMKRIENEEDKKNRRKLVDEAIASVNLLEDDRAFYQEKLMQLFAETKGF